MHGVSVKTQKLRQSSTAGEPSTRIQLTRPDSGSDLRGQLPPKRDRVAGR